LAGYLCGSADRNWRS